MGNQFEGVPRSLVADDDRDRAETLAIMLRQLGCDVRVVYSGSDAIAVAPEFRPQLVILDINMPGMDGYETSIALRRQAWSSGTVYVAHTVSRDALVAETVKKLGFHHHVPKPGTVTDFAPIVSSLRSRLTPSATPPNSKTVSA
jgi:CheY-like chemotaxis protein